MTQSIGPTQTEVEFLTLAYNRFYDIFEEVMVDKFFERDPWYRYSKIKEALAVYAELLNYEPISQVIVQIRATRPKMEAEIGGELFKFIRNVVAHFPFFDKWDDVWISQPVVNWYRNGQSIDKFLRKYEGHKEIRYRFWEAGKKRMTYLTIGFPARYDGSTKIYLREILTEMEGVKFAFILMRQIIDTQVEK